MSSLKDVSELTGVSMMTVSRVLNNPESVKEKTRIRVLEAIDKLKYVPDQSAQKMRNRGSKTKTIVILAKDTATTPYSVDILLEIEKTARDHNWSTYFINLFGMEDFHRAERPILALRPDGIILSTMGLRKVMLPSGLMKIPLALANCYCDDKNIMSFIPDNYQAQFNSTNYIIRRGYRKPLCLWLPLEELASLERKKGFEDAWKNSGLSLSDASQFYMRYGDQYYKDLSSIIKNIIAEKKFNFDIVICGNDRIAFVAYQTLLMCGVKIPEEVGVLGFDNMTGINDLFIPSLSTIQLPHSEMGRLSALHIIEGHTKKGIELIECPLIKRDSLL